MKSLFKSIFVLMFSIVALSVCACNGTSKTYDDGYEDGSKAGYKDGFDTGSEEGYSTGYEEGYADGYDEGYSDASLDDSNLISRSSDSELSYIGNKNTKKYHKSTCTSVLDMNESNKVIESKDYFESNGYKPCGKCNP